MGSKELYPGSSKLCIFPDAHWEWFPMLGAKALPCSLALGNGVLARWKLYSAALHQGTSSWDWAENGQGPAHPLPHSIWDTAAPCLVLGPFKGTPIAWDPEIQCLGVLYYRHTWKFQEQQATWDRLRGNWDKAVCKPSESSLPGRLPGSWLLSHPASPLHWGRES